MTEFAEYPKTYAQVTAEAGPVAAYTKLDVRIENGIATITMQDPDTPNAYGPRFCKEMRHALDQVARDDDVRAVILTGTGTIFTAGGDVRNMQNREMNPLESYQYIREEFGGIAMGIAEMKKPVIAAVNGYAMGVGFFTALCCDMIIASDRAKFGTAYILLGLTPLGSSHILARSIGYHRAFEMCALGDQVDAAAAEKLGFVNRVVAHDELMAEATQIAGRLAGGPPRAMAFCKEFLRKAVQSDLEDHLLMGEAVQPLLLFSKDHRDAVDAFFEKRAPRFTGH